MSGLTRREIKQEDQFVSTMEATIDYSRSHGKSILIGVVAVVGAILLAALIGLFLRGRERRADEALSAAVRTYSGTVVEAGDTADPDAFSPTFASEDERRGRARELLTEVKEDWGGADAGKLATVYLANLAAEEGNLEEAEGLWKEFVKGKGDHVLAMQVRLNLLSLRRSRGEQDAVAQELESMLDSDNRELPEDALLYELAVTLEELERPGEALGHYQRIVDEFPTSLYTGPARQKTVSLADAAPAVPAEAASAEAVTPDAS